MRADSSSVLRRMLATAVAVAALGALPAAAEEPPQVPETAVRESGEKVAVTASHRSHGRRHVRVHPRTRSGWSVGWGSYWGPVWGGYWYGPGWGYPAAYPRASALYGALNTDVSPERAEIWVDGRRVGVADDFDGFPTHLLLEKGTYDVVIYLPGYRTIARQYSIYPGLVIDVEDRMERGESVHPLDLETKTHERRDERLRRDRERRERVDRDERSWQPAPRGESSVEGWLDARGEPGRLLLRIEPADASVYLDGRFVGTGDDLARLRAGLLVDSGEHLLEVVRPGFASASESVAVGAGEEVELEVGLVSRASD